MFIVRFQTQKPLDASRGRSETVDENSASKDHLSVTSKVPI